MSRELFDDLNKINRRTSLVDVVILFHSQLFMYRYEDIAHQGNLNLKLKHKYQKIKKFIKIVSHFMKKFPSIPVNPHNPDLQRHVLESLQRITSILNMHSTTLRLQGKRRMFESPHELSITLICQNANLLLDKTQPWYQPLPYNTPHCFLKHMYRNLSSQDLSDVIATYNPPPLPISPIKVRYPIILQQYHCDPVHHQVPPPVRRHSI
jgi:hypothetical protein